VVILKWKTERLRKQTGNMALRSRLDSGISKRQIVKHAVVRPTKLLFLSVISLLLAIASAYVYGIFYILLTTFPLVFEDVYNFSTGVSGLSYIGLGVGNFVSVLIYTFNSDNHLKRRREAGKRVRPEDRLPTLVLSGPIIAAGLFWYGWTANEHVFWMVPILGTAVIGFGSMLFFLPVIGYLVDAFGLYAASALAANTVLRSVGGALLPLAGRNMYSALGIGWGNSLLGFLVLAFSPVLYLLYRYGETIRLKYSVSL
jgi:MFS family permease